MVSLRVCPRCWSRRGISGLYRYMVRFWFHILDSKANLYLDEVKGMINTAEEALKSDSVDGPIGLHLYLVLWNLRPAAASVRHERAF